MTNLLAQIETERLRLRLITAADAESVFQVRSDQGYQFIGTQPSREMFDLRFPNEVSRGGIALLAICKRADDNFVGEATFRIDEGDAEFTVAVLKKERGNKYGLEAAQALVQHALDSTSARRIVARVQTENPTGANLARELALEDKGVYMDSSGSSWQLCEQVLRRDA